jgi:hypothetical protein
VEFRGNRFAYGSSAENEVMFLGIHGISPFRLVFSKLKLLETPRAFREYAN